MTDDEATRRIKAICGEGHWGSLRGHRVGLDGYFDAEELRAIAVVLDEYAAYRQSVPPNRQEIACGTGRNSGFPS